MNEAAFLEAIAAEPDEDAHRLVFADWLHDNGDPDWAEFIRAQVELARTDEADVGYPALLARSRRCGMLTGPRRRPMLDHVPGGKVLFRRGLITGVEISVSRFLRQPSERWNLVPFDRLGLTRFRVDTATGGKKMAQRPELARVRTLTFEGTPSLVEAEPVLTESPHLGNVNALRLLYGLCNQTLMQRLALPALDSLALYVGEEVANWEARLPAHGPPLRRLAISGSGGDNGVWTWGALTLDDLLRTRHGPTLETALLRRNVWHFGGGYPYTAAAPLHDRSLLASSRLRWFETDGPSATALADTSDWGNVESLGVRRHFQTSELDRLLACPQALRLRSLLIEPSTSEFEIDEFRQLVRGASPAWRWLRLVDWPPDLLTVCSENLLRFALNDLEADLTFAEDAIEFPQLRELWLDLDEPPRNLPRLVASLKAPNLCTLVLLGISPPRLRTIRSLASLSQCPHLSLVGAGEQGVERWWVLQDGDARRVAPEVIPIERDWWDPLPDLPR